MHSIVVEPLAGKNLPADILLMQPLHNNNQRRAFLVIQARSRHFLPPIQGRLALCLAFGLFSIMRVVNENNIATNAEERTADRCSKPRSASTRVELRLSVLIFAKLESMPPKPLVPWAQDQPSGQIAVG
jgi:hypothetical protein